MDLDGKIIDIRVNILQNAIFLHEKAINSLKQELDYLGKNNRDM